MKESIKDAAEYRYELHDIQAYGPADTRGRKLETSDMTEELANQLNYARALNGTPLRWVKATPLPLPR